MSVRLHPNILTLAAGYGTTFPSRAMPARNPGHDRPSTDRMNAQLEGLWTSWDDLPAVRRSFLVVVGLIAMGRHLGPIVAPESITSIERARALVEEVASRHAYRATVTIGTIHLARNASGILPSMPFAALTRDKGDHAAWLMINGYGRRRHRAEIVGAFAHWEAEENMKRPIVETYFANVAEDMI